MTRSRGRFQSFSVVFSVISGENQRISEKNGEYRGNLSVFFPFHSFLFLLLKSARFYALQHVYCRYFVREVECLKYYCYFCT
nr:MAG TPA: Cytoplasmic polyadenylation element-binding protein [Caudoviricetes sp.]